MRSSSQSHHHLLLPLLLLFTHKMTTLSFSPFVTARHPLHNNNNNNNQHQHRSCSPTSPSFITKSSSSSSSTTTSLLSTTSETEVVPTTPIEGMRPGTSGLRKKVEVWQDAEESHYVENFIQSLIDVAKESLTDGSGDLHTVIVAGDGRYFNTDAMQIIFRVLAGNGVKNIWVPQNGIMSTPAVSAAIRERLGGKAQGGIILTASHNPGGPGEDFGIKYNVELGQPAGEEFTEALYKKSLTISSFKTIPSTTPTIPLNSPIGTTTSLTPTTTVEIIDPFDDYITNLKKCFDFPALRQFISSHPTSFSLLFDGMHGAGGPFARRILVDELGLDEDESLLRCDPREDFGECHPDPNLTYAERLIERMGLLPDGSPSPGFLETPVTAYPTLGAANDGDGDRNLIAGAGIFVTPSDSLAIIADKGPSAIPQFAAAGGLGGVARSMPTSAALDVVAKKKNIPCFVTPTGWKYFGNLMSSVELFGKESYAPFLCGEESFGTGSDHIREKDGLWAVLAWMSILMKENEGCEGDLKVSVGDIVRNHWKVYGRHFYCRYDYEGVDSDAANQLMDLIRDRFVNGDASKIDSDDDDNSGIKFVDAVEFSYTDPIDDSQTSNQGLILNFSTPPSNNPARVVFRLSGTGSAGATIRMYLERYETDETKHDVSAPVALKGLADVALGLVDMEGMTGRSEPTVIT